MKLTFEIKQKQKHEIKEERDILNIVSSLRMKAVKAKNEEGVRIFSKEDMKLVESILQKVKEIGLNCIKYEV